MIQHLEGDCRQVLPSFPAKSVNCAVSSPPYWAQRSYLAEDDPAKPLEIGQEATVKEYIDNLVAVFREVSRVLVNDGTLWVNLGDAYADKKEKAQAAGVKTGDLIGLPWRLAFALQADGWLLRSEIIWAKPNPKPESVQNRPTKAHESIFLFSSREQYYYDVDAIREPVTSTGGASFGKQRHSTEGTGAQSRRLKSAAERNHPLGKNKRSVWSVPVRSFPGAHFAVNVAFSVMWPTLPSHVLPDEKHAYGTSLRHIIALPSGEPSPTWFPSRIRWHTLPETASACRPAAPSQFAFPASVVNTDAS